MSVLQSIGYAYGVALVALAPAVPVVLLVPGLRRRLVTGPLRDILSGLRNALHWRQASRAHRQATMRITIPYTRPPE